MKFTVRKGFIVHQVDIEVVGEETVERRNTFVGGQTVDFDEATALNHLHKLEPADAAAQAFLESKAVVVTPPPAGIDPVALAQAVAATLAAMGVKPPAAPSAPAPGAPA